MLIEKQQIGMNEYMYIVLHMCCLWIFKVTQCVLLYVFKTSLMLFISPSPSPSIPLPSLIKAFHILPTAHFIVRFLLFPALRSLLAPPTMISFYIFSFLAISNYNQILRFRARILNQTGTSIFIFLGLTYYTLCSAFQIH